MANVCSVICLLPFRTTPWPLAHSQKLVFCEILVNVMRGQKSAVAPDLPNKCLLLANKFAETALFVLLVLFC